MKNRDAPVSMPTRRDNREKGASVAASKEGRLFSREFLSLCLVLVAAFCNVSVFYSFYHYLGAIGIPVAWRGFLVGLEPMAAFALRLCVLPWLHVRNALSVLTTSLILLFLVSLSYLGATTVPALLFLRVVHGAAFVLITASAIALVVFFIPGDKSGQGFSAVSIATMIPYAVIPSLSEALLPHARNEADIYAGVSVFALAAILLLSALRGRIGKALQGANGILMRRLTLDEIRKNYRLPAVVRLLSAVFLVYLAHAAVFYFLKDLALQIRAGDVGLFFTLSMAAMIAVRAFGAAYLDRIDKWTGLQKALALLVPCLILLPHAAFPGAHPLLAVVYGGCMGILLPLLNALLFTASPPPLRGLNANMTLFAMDAAYFLLPYLGGTLIALGTSFGALFVLAAAFVLLGLLATMPLARRKREERGTGDARERKKSRIRGPRAL